jgi:hypothetical protein
MKVLMNPILIQNHPNQINHQGAVLRKIQCLARNQFSQGFLNPIVTIKIDRRIEIIALMKKQTQYSKSFSDMTQSLIPSIPMLLICTGPLGLTNTDFIESTLTLCYLMIVEETDWLNTINAIGDSICFVLVD